MTGILGQIGALAATAVAVLGAWWVILSVAARKPRRICVATLAAFGVGGALSLTPLAAPLFGPAGETAAARVATFGATVAGLAALATAVVLVWTLFAALVDRL